MPAFCDEVKREAVSLSLDMSLTSLAWLTTTVGRTGRFRPRRCRAMTYRRASGIVVLLDDRGSSGHIAPVTFPGLYPWFALGARGALARTRVRPGSFTGAADP